MSETVTSPQIEECRLTWAKGFEGLRMVASERLRASEAFHLERLLHDSSTDGHVQWEDMEMVMLENKD